MMLLLIIGSQYPVLIVETIFKVKKKAA